ncbi:hypothetical protein BD311DRAFT_739741 [Dichomitus squalens]|uniref:Uncharacterized protein n=1 Tax=Dichomitus squalens TaxID=114155 RepID=A0A4Q9MJZ0_9APHY|nr:hypothetical protein BD311DRAFT_739741 [Dichomitus squalens]
MGGLPLRSPTHILMVFLSSLYGILVHQVYRYAGMYPSDPVVAEITVYATVFVPPVGKQTHLAELRVSRILETAHMAYYNHRVTTHSSSPLPDETPLEGLIVGTSQAFLARRVYMFEARYRIWVMIAGFVSVRMFRALSIWSTGILTEATIASTIVDLQYTTNGFAACIPKTWFEACAAGLALCADIILTTVLILALHRSRIGVKW